MSGKSEEGSQHFLFLQHFFGREIKFRRCHQEPPQCRGPARLCGLQGDYRAPAPALQGRGAAVRPRAGPA